MPAFVCGLLVIAAAVTPAGEPEAIKWKGKTNGYRFGGTALQLEVEGPTVLAFEIRGEAETRDATVLVEIQRDAAFTSKNTLTLKRKGKGPKGFVTMVKLMLAVPEGPHTYSLTADAELAVLVTTAKKLAKKLAAAPEEALPKPAGAQPEPEPAAELATAAKPPPPSPPATAAAPATAPATPPATPPAAPAGAETLAATPATTEAAASPPPDAAPAPEAAGTRPIRVAVSGFELQGVESKIGVVVSDSIVAEMRKLVGVSAIGMDEVQDMLSHEASKQMAGCDDEGCMAEIAGALGVDQMVAGSLTRAADSHVITLRRIDQRRAKVVGSFNQRLKADSGQEFLLAVGPAVEELFPDRGLRDGTTRGVPKEIALRLDPPPLPRWSWWTMASVTVATGVAGGVFAILFQGAQSSYNAEAKRSEKQVVLGSELTALGRDVKQHALTADILFGAAGALAITTGILWLFTDWEGYGDAVD